MLIITSFKKTKYAKSYIVHYLPPGKEQIKQANIIRKSLEEIKRLKQKNQEKDFFDNWF